MHEKRIAILAVIICTGVVFFAAQSRMRIMFYEVDGEPLKSAVRYCRALHTKEYTITNDKGYKLYATLYMAPVETDKYMFFIHGYNMTGLSDGCRFIVEYAKLGFSCFSRVSKVMSFIEKSKLLRRLLLPARIAMPKAPIR